MTYDPRAVVRFFDAFGFGEYERHDASREARIKYELHVSCLQEFVASGSRVLEIGAGPGRFTEILAEMGCTVTVVDLSPEQVRLNEERARERGYAEAIDAWLEADVLNLDALADRSYDAIIAFGGPFSYVLDRRDRALEQCLELLRPRGDLLLSVMSMWGTIHAFLDAVHDLSAEEIEAVLATGDVTPATSPSSVEGGHFFHMFTSDELRELLERNGLAVRYMSASNALSTTWNELLEDERSFRAVLELEREAARSPGSLDMGTHIIAVAGREASPLGSSGA